jgi:small subunit ribosomal protein S6
MLQHYEVLAILPGTVTEEESAPVAQMVQQTIEQNGGQGLSLSSLGKSRLAYPIRHIRYGYFYIGRFTCESTSMPVLREKLRLLAGTLRIIVNTVDPSKAQVTKISVLSDVREGRERAPSAPAAEPMSAKTVADAPVVTQSAVETTTTVEQIKVDDIDKKLDELLTEDIAGV